MSNYIQTIVNIFQKHVDGLYLLKLDQPSGKWNEILFMKNDGTKSFCESSIAFQIDDNRLHLANVYVPESLRSKGYLTSVLKDIKHNIPSISSECVVHVAMHQEGWKKILERAGFTYKSPLSLKQEVNSGLSPILYHWTKVGKAIEILKTDNFKLYGVSGDNDKEIDYYLSTSRSKHAGYHINKSGGAIIVLDGLKLGKLYKGGPHDWYHENPEALCYKPRECHDEMEDRVFSKKFIIHNATKYIKEVHILYDGESERDKKYYSEYLKNVKIPIYFYDSKKDWLLLNKRKASPLE